MKGIITHIVDDHFLVEATDYNEYKIRRRAVMGIEQENIVLGSVVEFDRKPMNKKIQGVTVTRIRGPGDIPECLVGRFFTVAEQNFLPNIGAIYHQ
ncbi:MAG: hypothetical protein GY774_29135 [Planctomycetes bacterium]|nr:hypothetical protein [Planctomycetota bacterium]